MPIQDDSSWRTASTPVRKLPITPVPDAPGAPAPETDRHSSVETVESDAPEDPLDVSRDVAEAVVAKARAEAGNPVIAAPTPDPSARSVPATPAPTPVAPLTPAGTVELGAPAPPLPSTPKAAAPKTTPEKKKRSRLSSPLSKMLSSKKKKSLDADSEPLSPGSRKKKSLMNSAIKGMKNATGLRKKTDPALKKIAADINVDIPPDGPSFSVPSPLTVPAEAVEAKDEVLTLAKGAPLGPAPESFLAKLHEYFPKLNLTCCTKATPGERAMSAQ